MKAWINEINFRYISQRKVPYLKVKGEEGSIYLLDASYSYYPTLSYIVTNSNRIRASALGKLLGFLRR